MVKVKICGLFRECDIDFVNEAKPDYAGFVLADGFRRRISPETAELFRKKLDKNIAAVGVFVNNGIDFIADICNRDIIDIVQLHGDESESFVAELKNKTADKKIIKAVKVKKETDVLKWRNFNCDMLLFDGGFGDGRSFDWNILKNFIRPYFLAGGINETNIEAAKKLNPYCIDISSGVETDGLKDKEKILKIVGSVKG